MGRGDRRSKQGKVWRGTNGKTRPKHKKIVKEKRDKGKAAAAAARS